MNFIKYLCGMILGTFICYNAFVWAEGYTTPEQVVYLEDGEIGPKGRYTVVRVNKQVGE